jgi:acetyltransferase-like isoleucine patch superfamily enzyme
MGAITIGAHTTIALGAVVQGNVILGENASVQAYSILVGYGSREAPTGQIRVGNGVRIAPHVMMIAANHVFSDAERPIHSQGLDHTPIVIEDDVWIGGRVNVIAGVTIGQGSVIGAGTVVTKDIPPYSVAVGVPARVIKSRLVDH